MTRPLPFLPPGVPPTLRRTLPTALLALAAACGPALPDGPEPAAVAVHEAGAPAREPATSGPAMAVRVAPTVAGGALHPASVYRLPGSWRDQHGRERSLADLAGRPRVVAFVYTSCAFACPRIVARMKAVEAGSAAADPGFLLVSLDPERDTPERLARFAGDSRLDPMRWTLLNGHDDRVRELSVLLDVAYRSAGGGDVSHENVLTLLDRNGVPAARVEGLDGDLAPLLDALERMAPPAERADGPER